MTYNAFLEGVSGTNWLTTLENYPNFKQHLKTRFGRFELLYDEETTLDMLTNVLLVYGVNLKQAEVLLSVEFKPEELGSSVTTTSAVGSEGNSDSVLSYTGYNVDSDYNKTNTKMTSNQNSNTTIQSLDKFKQVLDQNNREVARIYDSVDKDLFLIFQTLY